ncbi:MULTISPECIES: hypothetical protein [Pseudomonadota]|uniref:Uncharacterized protein n=3 Tax=Pseudomonadota TaxID=1224 RepID=A0A1W6YZ37_9BORD|nr:MULTISPECIES: hypothetical protein [Pseudomonadota]AOJ92611.1 hypothetical protein WK22_06670 [Burkholderia multivorans]ARP86350.1 hypothetical protein CAL13_09165 [Bordetella genomosp. 9]MCO1382019.1 hypothetical protein [Burkholderia multivorans]MCO1402160.1 hypothetical protein [Burkholderia multivorans]MDN8003140.1 hypothetical protein [Burkholderia multivorans]
MTEFLYTFGTLFVLFAIMYLLCYWLRARGHGPKLDAVADKIDVARGFVADRIMAPLGFGMLGAARAIHSVPLLGSKQQAQQLAQLVAQLREQQQAQQKRRQ